MNVIRTLLVILEAACCLSLICLILLQKAKGEGLGMAFGGGGNDSVFGARAGNVLTKATIGIGVLFLANTMILGILFAGSASESLMEKVASKSAPVQQQQQPVAPVSEIPAQ